MAITANANPTKGFFINMLTRDIELNDAILDLLDNCLDGVVRQQKKKNIERSSSDFYMGYCAHIDINADSFSIRDNCGGIPLDVAQKYAFRMGRDDSVPQEDIATVGIYGIGMKRAIFKIGNAATVVSFTPDEHFKVEIPEGWKDDHDNWAFQITMLDQNEMSEHGTIITVDHLNQSISQIWNESGHRESYVQNLRQHIQQSYSFIIERGFKVYVNNIEVEPFDVTFVVSNSSNGIQPFIYKGKYGNVSVSLVVGFYSAPPTLEQSDQMAENIKRRSTEDAGWTVICNDRVVLYNNKDHLTGWGENSVPRYHTQFIGIRGIVTFESSNPIELPMTTTKRGIDLSSPIYSEVKKKMCEGLKLFTNFTNSWKGKAATETELFSAAKRVSANEIISINDSAGSKKQFDFARTRDGGMQYKPSLPKPQDDLGYIRIRYVVKNTDFNVVSNYLFDTTDEDEMPPAKVGERCFNLILSKAQKDKEV